MRDSFRSLTDAELWDMYLMDKSVSIRNSLFERNNRLVYHVIKKFGCDHRDREDLFQEGSRGLLRAIERFNPAINNRFSTYACPFIWGTIAHYYRDTHHSIKFPREVVTEYIVSLNTFIGEEHDELMGLISVDPPPDEDFSALHEEVALLPAKYRQPIEDVYFREMPRSHCAKRLEISPMTVVRRMNKGVALLRGKLNASEF